MDLNGGHRQRFGDYSFDHSNGTLWRNGQAVKIQPQPLTVLRALLERPGQMVTREELRDRIWGAATYVDFEQGLNFCIRQIRAALNDNANQPRYIETLPKQGYRFIAPLEDEQIAAEAESADSLACRGSRPVREAAGGVELPGDFTGQVISQYRILKKVRADGTGVVYLAEDLARQRPVALEFLPYTAGEPYEQAIGRFERAAQAASALHHPNICTVYGFEQIEGWPVIVTESVDGETLQARLERRDLQRDQAIAFAIEIAAALAEAHRNGMAHRDLTPANIMLTKTGAKVLNFGIGGVSTRTAPDPASTDVGAVRWTRPYASPEQARGEEGDTRSDIFSFGMVVYEMLSGKRGLDGGDKDDVRTGTLNGEMPGLGSVIVERLVRRCLAEDPEDRWQSARDLKAELEWFATAPAWERPDAKLGNGSRWSIRLGWIGVGAIIAGLLAWLPGSLHEKAPEPPMVQLTVAAPENGALGNDPVPAVSPDGRRIVLSVLSEHGAQLWLRSLDSLTAVPLPGTEEYPELPMPFWSPDSRSIGFFAGGKLKRLDLGGPSGPSRPVALCDAAIGRNGGSWNREGVIVFGAGGVLYRVPDTGGIPTPVAWRDRQEMRLQSPWFLPDGRHFLFGETMTVLPHPIPPDHVTIRVGSLDSMDSKVVRETDSNAMFVHGRLIFLQDNTLMAQPFDPRREITTGDAVAVTEMALADPMLSLATFAASDNLLVYRAGAGTRFEFSWFDRNGNRQSTSGEPAPHDSDSMEFSPDQKAFAIRIREHKNTDIWLYDPIRLSRIRFTSHPANEDKAVWSPDGRTIVFSSNRKGHFDLYWRAVDSSAAEELLYADNQEKYPTSWSPDGKFLLYDRPNDNKSGSEIWVLPLRAGPLTNDSKPFPLVQTASGHGRFSPDGRWIAFESDESGRREVYLVSFREQGPSSGGKLQISTSGGLHPRWRRDGKEVFFVSGRSLMAASVELNDGHKQVGELRPLLRSLSILGYDVTADGQRFLVVSQSREASAQPLTVVQNWAEALQK